MAPTKIDLQIAQYQDVLGEDVFHFKAVTGRFTGFGTDFDRSTALIKACAECAERTFIDHLQVKSSNGMAAHSDPASALNAAKTELLERDAFLTLWLSGRSPKWIETKNIPMEATVRRSLELIESRGFQLKVGITATHNKFWFTTAALEPTEVRKGQFGIVFSSAGGTSLEASVRSLMFEMRRAASVIENRLHKGEVFENMPADEIRDGKTTFEYYLNPSNFAQIENFISNSGVPLEIPEIKVDSTSMKCEVKAPNFKFYVARAFSDQTQDLFFGKPTPSDINLQRLAKINAEPVNLGVMPLP